MTAVRGYVLRSQWETHLGTLIQRLEQVHDDGRRIQVACIHRDATHYVIARTEAEARRKVMAGGLDIEREPLVWVPETQTRRMFAIEGSTR